MMMDNKCPYCGSSTIEMWTNDDEWVSDTQFISDITGECYDCKKRFIISEVRTVTSRLVAKDQNELDALIVKEEEEDKEKKYIYC